MYKTATVLGREHRSHNHLNLLQDSYIRPLFENVPPVLNPFLRFLFSAFPLTSSIYSLSTILKRDATVTQKQLLDSISCC